MTDRPQHTNFTPGPWKHGYGFICDSDNTILAHVDRRCGTDATVEANAALIARAPELLARVEELEGENKAQHERRKLIEDKFHKKAEQNARLRELLRECHDILLGDAAELKNRIKAELAEGE